MLFFRSEEAVSRWCTKRALDVGPMAGLAQIWALAQGWYSDRLSETSRRPQPAEIRRIFAAAGLTQPEWNPLGDAF